MDGTRPRCQSQNEGGTLGVDPLPACLAQPAEPGCSSRPIPPQHRRPRAPFQSRRARGRPAAPHLGPAGPAVQSRLHPLPRSVRPRVLCCLESPHSPGWSLTRNPETHDLVVALNSHMGVGGCPAHSPWTHTVAAFHPRSSCWALGKRVTQRCLTCPSCRAIGDPVRPGLWARVPLAVPSGTRFPTGTKGCLARLHCAPDGL